jgi:hypothetical protein
MSILRNRHGAPGEVWKAHVLAKLKEPSCWICAQLVREVDRGFFWFVSEQYYEGKVVDKMRLAHGFCPNHTRHFLATGARSVNVSVFSYLTWYVIERLNAAQHLLLQADSKQDPRGRCRQAAAVLRPQGACPMCQSLRQTEMIEVHALLDALVVQEVKESYEESPGLCIPHLRQAGYQAQWDSLAFLARDFQWRLGSKMFPGRSSTVARLEQAVGLDRESSLRQPSGRDQLSLPFGERKREIQSYLDLANPLHPRSPTFEQMLSSLAEPGCPVCVACGKGIGHYLDWLACEMEAQRSSPGSWDLSWNICPSHLWELHAAGHGSAALLIAEHTIQEWLAKLDRLAAGLKHRPAAQWWKRWGQGLLAACGRYDPGTLQDSPQAKNRWHKVASLLESPRDRLESLRNIAFRLDLCQACSYVHTTTRRQLDLILRSLEDPRGRQAYHAAPGLCLRHCVEAAKIAEVPAALQELLGAQIARLRLLEWELEEASRKTNWSVRYEPKGPESDVWRRAAYQFCGV